MNSSRWTQAVLALCTAFTMGSVQAQSFPNKTINLIVPYPAGGPSDFFARAAELISADRLLSRSRLVWIVAWSFRDGSSRNGSGI